MPTTHSTLLAVAASALLATAACGQAPPTHDSAAAHALGTPTTDSAFAALQARGADLRAMGVDQYTSVHRFDALPDGGRIELQRGVDDSAGVAQIRRHLREIAAAFTTGDFATPAFVHAHDVPGTAVMAAKRGAISYEVHDLPRGGEVRITTHDADALRAVHEFIAFQRGEHRAGGAGDAGAAGHAHAGHDMH